MSRVKIAEKTVFLFSFQNFFGFWAKTFQTFGQKTSKSFQIYLRVQRNSLWLEFFFLKFWIVLDFVQKPSAWFSKFYLRVQSKNCGRNSFIIFLFRFFFGFWVKSFSDFRPQNFKKLTKLTSARPEDYFVTLNFFKKFWTVLDFLQKPLVWFSKIYLSAQSINCGCNSFFCSPFLNFLQFWANYFQTFGQKTSRICQNYLLRVQRNTLWLDFFLSFETFGFSAETFGMVLKILSTCLE